MLIIFPNGILVYDHSSSVFAVGLKLSKLSIFIKLKIKHSGAQIVNKPMTPDNSVFVCNRAEVQLLHILFSQIKRSMLV